LDDHWRQSALRICDQHRRGILTANQACSRILFFCVEPASVAEYIGLLPADLRAALLELLLTLPTSDDGWAVFPGVGQLDGDEWTWAWMIGKCRANTEAARACLLGEVGPPAAADFVDRVRTAYRKMLVEFDRSLALRQKRHAEQAAAPDPAGG
jgi:hypothetical protein